MRGLCGYTHDCHDQDAHAYRHVYMCVHLVQFMLMVKFSSTCTCECIQYTVVSCIEHSVRRPSSECIVMEGFTSRPGLPGTQNQDDMTLRGQEEVRG